MSGQAGDSDQDRSHDPTQTRIAKARREGDVAQSREANAAAQYLGLYAVLLFGAGAIANHVARSLSPLLARPEEAARIFFGARASSLAGEMLLQPALSAAALFAAPLATVAAALVAQRAFVFAPGKLKPRSARLSPIANARQKFGSAGLGEFAKGVVKLTVVIALLTGFFAARFVQLPAASRLPAQAVAEILQSEAILFLGALTLFSTALAAVDLPWTHHSHLKKLRMSSDEMKRESRESEGDPLMKFLRMERARAVATNRMMRDVPGATVVVVNPEHVAVALKWTRESGHAPICVAKGVDQLALKIREIAAAHGVPIRRDPLAARAIYATGKVGREIDRAHYAAAAAAIRFAEAVEKRRRSL